MSRIKTTDFDRLASSAPLNRQAAQDYGAAGDALPTRNLGMCEVFLAPPPGRPVTPEFRDFAGTRIDRARVVHLRAKQPGDGKHRPASWVLRCDCGNYYLKVHARLINPSPTPEREECPACVRERPTKTKALRAGRRLRAAVRSARKTA